MKKKLLLLLLAIVFPLAGFAAFEGFFTVNSGDIVLGFEIVSDEEPNLTCNITGLQSATSSWDGTLTIPTTATDSETGKTYNVIGIGDGAFSECGELKSVVIGDNIVKIGEGTFYNCPNLSSMSLGKGVTEIGTIVGYIFSGCSDQAKLTINCRNIGDNWFVNIPIKEIVLGDNVESIGRYSFWQCRNVTSVTIGENVKTIKCGAFQKCESLPSLTIPSSIETIEEYAFSYCTNLKSMHIKNGNVECGTDIFAESDALSSIKVEYHSPTATTNSNFAIYCGRYVKEIVIGNEVTAIADEAFMRFGITEVMIPETVTSIGAMAFCECPNLESIIIPTSVTSIGERACDGCDKLKSITIPSGVTSVGSGAFSGCESLTSITINCKNVERYWFGGGFINVEELILGEGVEAIADGAFREFDKVSTLVIPSTLTNVGEDAFRCSVSTLKINCKEVGDWFAGLGSLKAVIIGDKTEKLSDNAFSYCEGLESVTLGESVTTIGESAFAECEKLTNINIPQNLKEIGDNAFFKSGITSFVIPASIETVGVGAFFKCSELASVELHCAVIVDWFSGQKNLKEIIFGDEVTSIGDFAFPSASIEELTIGKNVTKIGESAFGKCTSLTSVVIPQSVEEIADDAFYGCSNLQEVKVLSKTPITAVSRSAFIGSNYERQCVLRVPTGTKSAYAEAAVWKDFLSIMEDGEGVSPGENIEAYAVLSDNNTVLTFYYDNQKAERGGMDLGPFTISYDQDSHRINVNSGWDEQRENITNVVFDASFAGCTTLTSTNYWFYGLENLSSITGISFLKTDNVTDMSSMFSGCSSLTSLDVTGFKTDNVTNMGSMFYGCSSLMSLDVTGFKAGNVTNLSGMFSGCSGLTSLDVTGFKTDNVTNMVCMFQGCSSLTSLDVTGFKTDNVTDMYRMFSGCSGLTSLDVTGFKTDNVTNMSYMFDRCSGLTSLDVTGFKTDNVTNMSYMFNRCSGLTSLDVTGFKTDNVTSMTVMFSGCSDLTSLDLSGFKTDNVTEMGYMFSHSSGLTTIYVGSGWSINAVTKGEGMFADCTSLVGGNGTVYDDAHTYYTYAHIDGGTDNPGYFTSKEAKAEVVIDDAVYQLDEEGSVTFVGVDKSKAVGDFVIPGSITVDDVEVPVKEIAPKAFENCTGLVSVTIPANIQVIGDAAFKGCTGLEEIYCLSAVPIDLSKVFASRTRVMLTRSGEVITQFEGIDFETCILYVPAGSKKLYEQAEGWKEFKNIVEMGETAAITIGKSGKASYCGDKSLDFGYSDKVKAYIATGFDKDEGTIWLTRVKDVPAGVPVLIKGEANKTYDVPVTNSQNSYYTNMFVGNTSGDKIQIQETDGDLVNYYLSGDGTFKSVNKTANIGNNKCYLQLPGTFEAAATGATQTVKVGSIGKASFAAPVDLDFTNVSGLKAFTATGYDKSTKTIWLTRVMKVQKGEGVLLKGDPNSYEIPSAAVQSRYENMFVGNTSGDEIQVQETSEDGSQTNYYLSGKDGSFVSVSGYAKIGDNKCYLALPTSMVAVSSTRSAEDDYKFEEPEVIKLPIEFKSIGSEGDGTTDVKEVKSGEAKSDEWFTLQGQRVAKPGKGLYIRNGKKVVIK